VLKYVKRIAYQCGYQNSISLRRFRMVDRLMDGLINSYHSKPVNILDVGCSIGKDFIKFLKGRSDINLFGIDIIDTGLRQDNFNLILGDASEIPFPNKYFDFSISIGVLEHIIPIEKLSMAIKEINRISKSYISIVPSNGTLIEPHVAKFFWHLQDRNHQIHYKNLIYMSDEAWMSFEGFENAKTERYWHIPFLISNLIIYKKD